MMFGGDNEQWAMLNVLEEMKREENQIWSF
jgi:hypothetical protein